MGTGQLLTYRPQHRSYHLFKYAATWRRHQMKTFPRYWPFVRGIHQSFVVPLTKTSDGSFDVLLCLHMNKRLSKQSRRRWFGTPSHPLWRHCNDVQEQAEYILFTGILGLSCMPVKQQGPVPRRVYEFMIQILKENNVALALWIIILLSHNFAHVWWHSWHITVTW